MPRGTQEPTGGSSSVASGTGGATAGGYGSQSHGYGGGDWGRPQVEHTTETRRSTSTSEFWLFVILSVVLLFFAYDVGTDSFSRDDGWKYVTWLGIGYMLSRGLAKAGSKEHYLRDRGER